MSEAEATPAPRKRRWFRFGLRTMLVLVTLVAVLLAITKTSMDRIRRRNEFIAEKDALWVKFNGPRYSGMTPIHRGSVPAPFPLGLFGEQGVKGLQFHMLVNDDAEEELVFETWKRERARAQILFPEANNISLHPLPAGT